MKAYFTDAEINNNLNSLRRGEVVVFKLPGLVDERLNFLSGFFFRLLNHFNVGYLSEMLLVIIREITGNCSRAAAKRLYFIEQNLNINDEVEYSKGISHLKTEVTNKWSEYVLSHEKSEFYIELELQIVANKLKLQIINNVILLPVEKNRILTRLESFHKFDNITEAFATIGDTTEGAGLGLFFLLSLLKNSNIPPKNFRILPKKDRTVHEITIPFDLAKADFKSRFHNGILNEIDSLPVIPASISKLLDMCESTDSDVEEIASLIQQDAALTVQVLKLVNSAGYMSRNRNPGLLDAVKIIGLRGLRDLLMVSGARHVMEDRYRIRELESIWTASNQVSCFARQLSHGLGAKITEQATIAGLLASLGRIILLSMHPILMQHVTDMLGSKRVRNESILEEIMIGISNAEIGAIMAEKWNFPTNLVEAIRFQHCPLNAPEENKKLVRIIYMANCMQQSYAQMIDYWFVEPEILSEFGLDSEEAYQKKVQYWGSECKEST